MKIRRFELFLCHPSYNIYCYYFLIYLLFLLLYIKYSYTCKCFLWRNKPTCLTFHAWHDYYTTNGFELSYPESSKQHPPNAILPRRISLDTLSTSLTRHIILIMRRSTPRNLTSSAAVSFHVSQQYNKTGLTQHW